MKKKKGVGRNISKNKNLFNDKKLLAITIGVFLVLGIALNFVGVDGTITGHSLESCYAACEAEGYSGSLLSECKSNCYSIYAAPGASGTSGTLTKMLMGQEEFGEVYLRWTIFGFLTVLLFSIFSSVGWPENPFLRWILSMPIAFISVSLVNRADLFASMSNYGALAMTAIVMIPLAIMFFFSAMLLQGKTSVGKIIFQFIGWYYYLAFTLYVFVSWINTNYVVETNLSWWGMFGYHSGKWSFLNFSNWWSGLIAAGGFLVLLISASGLVAIIIILRNRPFRRWIRALGRELIKEVQLDAAAAVGTP